MRRLAALSIVMLALPAASFAQARGPSSDTTTRAVDRVFAAWQSTDGPGCALGVSRNGRAVYEHGYGMANLETGTPITPSSIFHVASVSKQFTAAAIMLLARDGKLSLDDDVRKYIPELPDYGVRITIRHLLTHTSGLRDQWNLLALARGRFEEDRITEADVMDIVPRQKALNFTPGAEYLYSNTGYTLAAVIVKRVSGKSLREFADERIFRPLGMTSTHFHDDYTMLVPGRTSAYASRGSGWRVSIPNYDTYGATSLFTTVGDLLKWEANFDAPVVGDRALLDQMQTSGRLTHFVAGLGTSGTFIGTGRRLRKFNPAIALISFQPASPLHGLEGLKHMESAIVPGIYDPTLADEDLRVDTESAYRMVKRLAREEGLMAGVSSGAALVATLQIASRLDRGVVVTVFPDGAEKYLTERFWTADV